MPMLDNYLSSAIRENASDIHLISNTPAIMRVDGRLKPFSENKFSPEELQKLLYEVLLPEQVSELETTKELDFAYSSDAFSERFRVNVHYQLGVLGSAWRLVPSNLPGLEELSFAPVLRQLSQLSSGLILITGLTGSGKSTTQAMIIDLINSTKAEHIITIEDPVEFHHHNQQSIIEQREIGRDTNSFAEALKRALRQDPDVILVGEMRDMETTSAVITAAATGHLVISTLHTADTTQSIDRIIDIFPAHQQSQIRLQLSMSIEAVISQQLIPKKNSKGRLVAAEILLANEAVRNIIRKGTAYELYSIMEIEKMSGMRTMRQAKQELKIKDLIE